MIASILFIVAVGGLLVVTMLIMHNNECLMRSNEKIADIALALYENNMQSRVDFHNMKFCAGMRVRHRGNEYDIVSVDFYSDLIGVEMTKNDECLTWLRCEECKIIDKDKV
jgi:hypothetical protein